MGKLCSINKFNSTNIYTSERNFCLYISSHGKGSAYKDLHPCIVYDKNNLEWAVEETVVYSENEVDVLNTILPR